MMPRSPAVITFKIPLFLIHSVVSRGVKKAGEELLRIVVKKIQGHYCNISVRTRTVCRVLRPDAPQIRATDFFEVTT